MTSARMKACDPAPARRVPFVDFAAQYAEERPAIEACLEEVFGRGDFIGGAAVGQLEEALAEACGRRTAVALNSGTDALMLGMAALGIGAGDEVITPPNSFVASTAAIVHIGATPVFADVLDDQNIDPAAVEAAITPRTKAIMPVHLTGRIADMTPIQEIAEHHGLLVIEDAAQSIGSRYAGRPSGGFGDVACFSAHPLKNLNAAGDAGFLVTDREDVAETARLTRNHGLADRNTVQRWGLVSRMDTLQARLLLMRLERFDSVIERRRANAARYRSLLNPVHVFVPPCRDVEFNSFHTFVVQVEARDALQAHLKARGIETAVHYPVPIHLQPAARDLGYRAGDLPVAERQAGRILSLPVHQFLLPEDIEQVSATINGFYR